MKINVLSDLHLNHEGLPHPANDAEVVILAGDIARPAQAIAWATQFDKPVIYVPGNHEFYGDCLDARRAELHSLCGGTNVHLLDQGTVVIDGVRFIGTTLWTNLELFGDGDERTRAIDDARRFLRDFSRIWIDAAKTTFLSPERSAMMHRQQHAWLAAQLAQPFDGDTVVVTHHAPSAQSIHPRFAGSPLNLCFVSDLEAMLNRDRVKVWIHGHTHDSFDYVLNGTRVVCNPRGYAVGGVNENSRFDPDFIVDVGSMSREPPHPQRSEFA